MTANDQTQLGNTLWKIADELRGAMNADDFCDYMLSFLFLQYLFDILKLLHLTVKGPSKGKKKKMESLKRHKKGLLQVLFPDVNEVNE